ncbi:MAG TPA: hypothetical protein VGI84_01345 [Pseudonocardiaceae bacterium]|jgi:hypothetical protein
MIVDCDSCTVRGDACGDCVITVLLGAPPGKVEFDGAECRALDTLAAAGMVPRLQLVNRDGARPADGEQDHGASQPLIQGDAVDRAHAKRSAEHGERSKRHAG